MNDQQVLKTPLFDAHVSLGARMMPFAGFEMPVQYTGIIDEHMTVRERVGLFDVSHMGEIFVTGPHAFDFVQHLVTNDASKLYDGRAMYTVMCTREGGIIDDLLVYRVTESRYLLVVNAAGLAADFAWMQEQNNVGAQIENASERIALLAVQGPNAFATVNKLIPVSEADLKYYHFRALPPGMLADSRFGILSHTGYTGERGLEIYCDSDRAAFLWERILEAGAEFGIKPIGLGARDTLRLEAGYYLYGNDLTQETNPLEAGLGWLTKLDKGDFVGRDALLEVRERGIDRKFIGFVAQAKGIPRHGDAIEAPDGTAIGTVTSGTQSPSLRQGIGLGYVRNHPEFTEPGANLVVVSRVRQIPIEVKRPPLHKQ